MLCLWFINIIWIGVINCRRRAGLMAHCVTGHLWRLLFWQMALCHVGHPAPGKPNRVLIIIQASPPAYRCFLSHIQTEYRSTDRRTDAERPRETETGLSCTVWPKCRRKRVKLGKSSINQDKHVIIPAILDSHVKICIHDHMSPKLEVRGKAL